MIVVDGDTVRLRAGARVADVEVRAGEADFEPVSLELREGDVLRLIAADLGPHAIVFDAVATDSAGYLFLEATGQSRGLPLLVQGAAWLVSFTDAPAGAYAARCLTHSALLSIRLSAATGSAR
jgi:plastocyanin